MSTKEKLSWTDEYSVGSIQIDKDHKSLFRIYNLLVEQVNLTDNGEFAKILSSLTDYSLVHFIREEDYMEELSYPNLEAHKKMHRDFIFKVAMYNVNMANEKPPEHIEIISFLENWLSQHILVADMDYENFRREKGLKVDY